MVYRTTDENGDMMPITAQSQMLTGVDAVMAAVVSRLRLLYGEWWEDESLGFRVPEFLFNGVRQKNGRDMLASYITSYIMETEDVTSVRGVTAEMIDRKLQYACTVITAYGSAEGSVDQDVLLRAVS